MAGKIDYGEVMSRIKGDVDYVAEEAYNKGYEQAKLIWSSKANEESYQRGLEDGKRKSEDGCTGCKYEGKTGEHLPCEYCKNNFRSQWTAKDDKIEVGDEVYWSSDCFIVTRIFQPRNQAEQCDGIDDDGCVYHDVLIKDLEKTGRHFDIAKILEEMRHD